MVYLDISIFQKSVLPHLMCLIFGTGGEFIESVLVHSNNPLPLLTGKPTTILCASNNLCKDPSCKIVGTILATTSVLGKNVTTLKLLFAVYLQGLMLVCDSNHK